MLSVAAAVNGEDFVPFNEALFIKEPGRGASVARHQDSLTPDAVPIICKAGDDYNLLDLSI